MSKKRKPQHHNPSGNTPRIPHATISRQDSATLESDVNSAPILNPPIIQSGTETGLVLNVRKVGLLKDTYITGEGYAYLQTVNGEYYRLPINLNPWANDLVTMELAMGGSQVTGTFPTRIEFGILNGRTYAEMLDDD